MAYSGYFRPKNPQKYQGDPTNICYRSSWELKFMKWLDTTDNIISWQSEEFSIPYYNPVKKTVSRYFPDFLVRMRTADGKEKVVLIEVKPEYQTKEPVKKGRVTKRYVREVLTYKVNEAKWKAARQLCEGKGWEFQILDEYSLGYKERK